MIFTEQIFRYATPDSKDVLMRMQNFYSEAITHNQAYWTEANIDTQFLAGSQSYYNELYGPAFPGKRKNFYFNRIRPIVNMVSGRQRQQRKTTIVTPRENADNNTADQLTKVMMWVHEQDMMYESISNAFLGALTTGMSLLQVWVDYRSDPISGDIRVDYCPFNYFLIDPFFQKMDFSDCTAVWKRSYLTKREIISLLPEHSDEILKIPCQGKDGKFNYNPNSFVLMSNNRMTYDEFWYRDYRMQTMLIDTKTGETREWRGDKKNLDEFLRAYPEIVTTKVEIPTVKCAIVVEGVVIENSNLLGIDHMPFVPVLGYYHHELPNLAERIQGIVRGLRDPQYLFNRRLVIEADMLESMRATGWIYQEDALVNPNDIFEAGNGKGLAIKRGKNIQEAVQAIQPTMIPPTTQELRKDFGDEIQREAGVSDELLGAASDDIAGVLSMLRQGAGLTTLQILFDQLDQSQKLLGTIILDLVQTNFMPGKIQNILGKDTEISPSFHSRLFGKYNCVIEEGTNTTTQKQMQFAQLMELKKLGLEIPDSTLIEACTLQKKEELMQAIDQNAKQAQESQQMQMQVQMQELQARAQMAQSKSKADEGLAIERVSRVEENQSLAVERRAAAKKDEELAVLNMVRALKEIEDIDINQIHRLVELSKILAAPTEAGQGAEPVKPTTKPMRSKPRKTQPKAQNASANTQETL